MAETFQSLGVLVLALLPGALYVWAFERRAGATGRLDPPPVEEWDLARGRLRAEVRRVTLVRRRVPGGSILVQWSEVEYLDFIEA